MRSRLRGECEFQIPNSKFRIAGFAITLRHAIRVLLKPPGFNGVVIVVLAVGIGATTAIFTIVNGVLLKRLPFADAPRLVAVRSVRPSDEGGSASFPDFHDWRATAKTFDTMAAYTGNAVTMTGRGDAVSVPIASTSADLFTVFGVKPLAGRVLVVAEAARLGGIGLALGLAGAVAASRMVEGLLFGVSPSDPLTFAG